MAIVDVYDFFGKKVAQEELDDSVFAAQVKPYLHTEIVNWQRACRRAGTQSALTKGEVSGTTKKPFAQKGRGCARQGSLKNPHQKGGGVAFAPKPRDYSFSIPKSKKRAALASVLSARMLEGSLRLINKIDMKTHKTKLVSDFLKNSNISSCLFVAPLDQNLRLGSRNHASIKYIQPEGVNVEDVLRFPNLVLTVDAVKNLQERLLG